VYTRIICSQTNNPSYVYSHTSHDGSVGEMTCVRFPARRGLFFCHQAKSRRKTHPASYPTGTCISFLWGKKTGAY